VLQTLQHVAHQRKHVLGRDDDRWTDRLQTVGTVQTTLTVLTVVTVRTVLPVVRVWVLHCRELHAVSQGTVASLESNVDEIAILLLPEGGLKSEVSRVRRQD
jgi:hypothetical protein